MDRRDTTDEGSVRSNGEDVASEADESTDGSEATKTETRERGGYVNTNESHTERSEAEQTGTDRSQAEAEQTGTDRSQAEAEQTGTDRSQGEQPDADRSQGEHPIDEQTLGEQLDAEQTERERRDLVFQIEQLATENTRLRREYSRAKRSTYRSTAIGFFSIGILAIVAGLLFPDTRAVLFALGATGLFGALLTYYLTPGTFVAAETSALVYRSFAENFEAICEALELSDERRYIPQSDPTTARLFVPQHAGVAMTPSNGEERQITNEPIFRIQPDSRGLVLTPSGLALYREFEQSISGPLATALDPLCRQLTDALIEQFEFVGHVETDIGVSGDQVTLAITDSAFGPLDRFDHPVVSFVAVSLAIERDRDVTVGVSVGDVRSDWIVTFHLDSDEQASP